MPPPTDSERRKAKDATLRTQDDVIAEHLPQALRSGELASAPSFGKPMPEADGWHETPAEFRLCDALARGLSLKACAQQWNRSYDTLRSQLKSILAKTGTHRQPELIALLDTFRTL